MIKHDDKYLYGGGVEYDNHPEGLELEVVGVAKRYYEHMIRWRGIDEMPDDGERIEVAYSVGGKPDSTYICDFHDTFDPFVYAWRPVGELPEVRDVA